MIYSYRMLRRQVRSLRGTQLGKPAIISRADVPRTFDKYVFIAGLHRSGTTMMEQMLQAYCDVATLRADVPENEGQHLQDIVPAARDLGGPGRFAFNPEMHTKPVPSSERNKQRHDLLSCWTPWMTEGSNTFLEKSPPNLVRLPWLRSLFPGARFLIMVRDPRVSAAATQKWSGTSIQEMVQHWNVAYSTVHAQLRDDCEVLRYEDMCADPHGSLNRIIDRFNLHRRSTPGRLDQRFDRIRNSNPKYLDQLEPQHFGQGVWDEFGYDLTLKA